MPATEQQQEHQNLKENLTPMPTSSASRWPSSPSSSSYYYFPQLNLLSLIGQNLPLASSQTQQQQLDASSLQIFSNPLSSNPIGSGSSVLSLSGNDTDQPHDPRDESLATIEILVQALIFAAAVAGNGFILYALVRQRAVRPWSRIYLLMAHLSLADLLVAFFNILPQLIWDITFRFRAGDALCRAVKYGQIFVLYLSTYLLVVMSVDRFLAVVRPQQWNSSRLTNQLVASAWTLSAIFSLPQLTFFGLKELRPGVWDCWATFDQPWAERAYVTWFVGSVFGVPLVIICLCYGAICVRIWRYKPRVVKTFAIRYHDRKSTSGASSSNSAPGGGGGGFQLNLKDEQRLRNNKNNKESIKFEECPRREISQSLSKAKLKTIKLTMTVVICFLICWTPFCATQLYLTFRPSSSGVNVGPLPTIFLLLASLNSCCNPWIYIAFSESLASHLKSCLGLNRDDSSAIYELGQVNQEPLDSVGDQDDINQRAQRHHNHASPRQPTGGATYLAKQPDQCLTSRRGSHAQGMSPAAVTGHHHVPGPKTTEQRLTSIDT